MDTLIEAAKETPYKGSKGPTPSVESTWNNNATRRVHVKDRCYDSGLLGIESVNLLSSTKLSTILTKPPSILCALYFNNINDKLIKEELINLKNVLNSSSNYISYYFKESDGNIYAIDICVLDIKNKKIYIFEIIT